MQNLTENSVTHVGTSDTLSGWWQDMGESSHTELGGQEEGALLLNAGDGSLIFCGRIWTITSKFNKFLPE